MGTFVTISHRFCGPAASGNGGYSCGATAVALGGGAVTVRLAAPPPLDIALRVEREDDAVRLVAPSGELVARARPAGPDDLPEVPPAPTLAAVRDAMAAFDVAAYADAHPFPRCFTCGPGREPGDGLRIFPAPLPDGSMVVWTWTPDPTMADDGGTVTLPMIWAALDCPSGQAFMQVGPDPAGPSVLGEMSVEVHRRPDLGEEVVVGGWRRHRAGRRLLAGSALWSADGALMARAAATWIELDAAQSVAFGADA